MIKWLGILFTHHFLLTFLTTASHLLQHDDGQTFVWFVKWRLFTSFTVRSCFILIVKKFFDFFLAWSNVTMSLMLFQLSQRTQWSLSFDVKPEMCWQKGGSVVTFLLKSDLLAFIWLMRCELNWCEGGRGIWRMVLKQPIRGLSPHNADDQLTALQRQHFLYSFLNFECLLPQNDLYQILFCQRRWPRRFAR